jgi:hypothetical protein
MLTNSTEKHATVRLPTERAGVDLFALGSPSSCIQLRRGTELPDTNKSTPAASLCEARMPVHAILVLFALLMFQVLFSEQDFHAAAIPY